MTNISLLKMLRFGQPSNLQYQDENANTILALRPIIYSKAALLVTYGLNWVGRSGANGLKSRGDQNHGKGNQHGQ